MRYRTKLYLALAGTALVSSLTGFGVLWFEFRHHAFTDEQSKVLTVAATTAVPTDPRHRQRCLTARTGNKTSQKAHFGQRNYL